MPTKGLVGGEEYEGDMKWDFMTGVGVGGGIGSVVTTMIALIIMAPNPVSLIPPIPEGQQGAVWLENVYTDCNGTLSFDIRATFLTSADVVVNYTGWTGDTTQTLTGGFKHVVIMQYAPGLCAGAYVSRWAYHK